MIKSPNHRVGRLLRLSALLAAILAWEIFADPVFLPEVTPRLAEDNKSTSVLPNSTPAEANPEISKFSEFIQRPLFTQSRRPAPPKLKSNAAPVKKKEDFDVIGIIVSANERMALLRTLSTGEVMHAVEGQIVGGWEISAIKPTQIVLKRGEDRQVIKISDAAVATKPSAANNFSASGGSPTPAVTGTE